MKRIAILGSTGSIGTQALELIQENSGKFEVFAVSCEKNTSLLSEQIEKFKPQIAVAADEKDALLLSRKHPGTEIFFGAKGLALAASAGADMVLNALSGTSGLVPTYEAAKAGKVIAFANKETLVAGGSIIMKAVHGSGAALLPVDSEHCAIWQCLLGNSPREVRRLVLTASGGPFRGYSLEELKNATPEQALRHPRWNMGRKITVDSATMMNKGLEIIEAKWLFDMRPEMIDVVVHPQSIVHSMVEYCDGAVIAQMGKPDMKGPIGYALAYPERLENKAGGVDFAELGSLTFEKPDEGAFACMRLARQAIKDEGSSSPVVLNAANEALVRLFLEKKIGFLDIQSNIERALEAHTPVYGLDIDGILELDKEIREGIGNDSSLHGNSA
ncbi:MAG: 1-deoxy-D-xylulose-5-phosphate reductoisomerase [Clostridiales bacterium]|nr:1-deoxy-D-xylulose-5-phosphate reductoisomerase [Clostridiales bacterium]